MKQSWAEDLNLILTPWTVSEVGPSDPSLSGASSSFSSPEASTVDSSFGATMMILSSELQNRKIATVVKKYFVQRRTSLWYCWAQFRETSKISFLRENHENKDN